MHALKIPPPDSHMFDDFDAYIARIENDFGSITPLGGSGGSSSYMPSGELQSLDGFVPLPLMPPLPASVPGIPTQAAIVSPTSSYSRGTSPRSVRRSGCGGINVREHVSEIDEAVAMAKERNRVAQHKHRVKHRTEFSILKAERADLLHRTHKAESDLTRAQTELTSCKDAINVQRTMINRLMASAKNTNSIDDQIELGIIGALEQCALDMRITRDIAQAQQTTNSNPSREPPCEPSISLP